MQTSIIGIHRELEFSAQNDPQVRKELQREGAVFYSEIEKKSLDELMTFLAKRDFRVHQQDFIQAAKDKVSAKELLDELRQERHHRFLNMWDEDIAHLCFIFLWRKINEDHPCVELYEESVYTGYVLAERENYPQAIKAWYKAYELLFYFIQRIKISSLQMLKDYFEGEYKLDRWLEDFSAILMHSVDIKALRKLRTVCESFITQFQKEQTPLLDKLKINLAQSYFIAGQNEAGEKHYIHYLDEYPLWTQGWLVWSDNYWLNASAQEDFHKAEEILLKALDTVQGVDSIEILERLKQLYRLSKQIEKEISVAEKIANLKKELPQEETEEDLIEELFRKQIREKYPHHGLAK